MDQDLAVAFAREVSELTGETPSCLYQWGKDLGLPVPKARQTFYSHLASDGWERRSDATSTEACRMGSYPMSCELRLRVVSLVTQFRRDINAETKRQLIILIGYEVCSHLIHFRVYRGPDYEGANGIPLCEQLPAATVATFVEECGRMVGLPLQRIVLTQDLMEMPSLPANEVALLALSQGKVVVRKKKEESGDNELLCSFGQRSRKQVARYVTLEGKHPFIEWCGMTNATKLTSDLSDLVKLHNKTTALPRLETAQEALDALVKRSNDALEARRSSSHWPAPQPPFQARMRKHYYALERFSLHQMRFYKRKYENFKNFPGDIAPVVE